MKAIIVDDETSCRESLGKQLATYCENLAIIGETNSVTSAYNAINALQPDLVFLDVEMQDGNAFDLLKKFDKILFHIIFTTAYDKYAIKAFQYSAVDFLLKPVEPEMLIRAVEKVRLEKRLSDFESKINVLLENQSKLNKIALPCRDGFCFVKLDNIIRIEADNNYSHFYLDGEKNVLVSKTLKEYAALLPETLFFRTHKSHLVNLNFIKQYVNRDGGYIIMEDGTRVELSRRKKDEFVRKINI